MATPSQGAGQDGSRCETGRQPAQAQVEGQDTLRTGFWQLKSAQQPGHGAAEPCARSFGAGPVSCASRSVHDAASRPAQQSEGSSWNRPPAPSHMHPLRSPSQAVSDSCWASTGGTSHGRAQEAGGWHCWRRRRTATSHQLILPLDATGCRPDPRVSKNQGWWQEERLREEEWPGANMREAPVAHLHRSAIGSKQQCEFT